MWPLIAYAGATILGGIFKGRAEQQSGDVQYRIAILNAESILKTSELNAQLIEQSSIENATISDFNARMSEAKAKDALYRARETEKQFGMGIRAEIGAQRASYGAQGIDVNLGSALDVQTDTAYQGALDALTIRVNGAREAWGFQVEAANTRLESAAQQRIAKLQAGNVRQVGLTQSLAQRMQGEYAKSAGKTAGLSTILGTAAGLANEFYQSQRRQRSD